MKAAALFAMASCAFLSSCDDKMKLWELVCAFTLRVTGEAKHQRFPDALYALNKLGVKTTAFTLFGGN